MTEPVPVPTASKRKAYLIIGLVVLAASGVALSRSGSSGKPAAGSDECRDTQVAAVRYLPDDALSQRQIDDLRGDLSALCA
jgi:hypothetical protein